MLDGNRGQSAAVHTTRTGAGYASARRVDVAHACGGRWNAGSGPRAVGAAVVGGGGRGNAVDRGGGLTPGAAVADVRQHLARSLLDDSRSAIRSPGAAATC